MPQKCAVRSCRGNYKNGPKACIFRCPSDELIRQQWLKAVKREDVKVFKHFLVCIRHFKQEDIQWLTSEFDEKNGRLLQYHRKVPKLRHGAVPSIFQNNLDLCSSDNDQARSRRVKINKSNQPAQVVKKRKSSKNSVLFNYKVTSFESLSVMLDKFKCSSSWECIPGHQNVVFASLILEDSGLVSLDSAILIDCTLNLNVTYKGQKLNKLGSIELPFKVSSFSEISNTMAEIESLSKPDSIDTKLSAIVSLLQSLIANDKESRNLAFLLEQTLLLNVKNECSRFSPEMLVFSSMLYIISPQAYTFIRDSGKISLPHPSTLWDINSETSMHCDSNNSPSLNYVKQRFKGLKTTDTIVALSMEEIHLTSYFEDGDDIVETAYKNSFMAKTIYVFMVKSLSSNYHDVVHILPSSEMTAELLSRVLNEIIIGLEKIGFKVVVVVTDNKDICRKSMRLFNNPMCEYVYPHPSDGKRPLFYCVDTSQLIISIRNDWVDQQNAEQAMHFPHFDESSTEILTASFKSLKYLYESDKKRLAKHALTHEALWPVGSERQVLELALQVFDNKVGNSLEKAGNKVIEHAVSTSQYITLIDKWFKVVNVKSPFDGAISEMFDPLTNGKSDENVKFLNCFLNWLERWKVYDNDIGQLSEKTLEAVALSTECIIELTHYCTAELNMRHLLPGKLRNDNFEFRFGMYKRASGTNYHTTIRRIFETQGVKRDQSPFVLTLQSSSKGIVEISEIPNCDTYLEDPLKGDVDFASNVSVTDDDISNISHKMVAITYLSAFCIHTVFKIIQCDECKNKLTVDKELQMEKNTFKCTNSCETGSLLHPSIEVVNVVVHNFIVLQKLLSDFETEFLSSYNHRDVALIVTMNVLNSKEQSILSCDDHEPTYILQLLIRFCSSTLLRNYCKNKSVIKVQNDITNETNTDSLSVQSDRKSGASYGNNVGIIVKKEQGKGKRQSSSKRKAIILKNNEIDVENAVKKATAKSKTKPKKKTKNVRKLVVKLSNTGTTKSKHIKREDSEEN